MRIKPRKLLFSRRRRLQRIAKFGVVFLLWMWLSSTIGMLFFHDYYKKTPKANNNVADPMIPGVSQPKFIAQEARLMAPNEPHTSPLLIFTCQRDNYLKQTLDDILKYIPPDCSIGCPIIISQDGNNQNVANVIRDAQIRFQTERNIPLVHLVHPSALRGAPNRNAYQALAIHYGWALTQVFDNKAQAQGIHVSPERVIILEEDLHIAPDFFGYFAAMVPVLDNDSTLFAVSAFNDNGFEGRVSDPRRLLRTDFFPGLGWMMTRRLWDNELKMKWPDGYWDDWLRDSRQRQGRQVIRPEVSRTYHFGFEGGASGNQFGRLLQKIHLDTEAIDWGSLDISLLSPEMFDRYYWNIISNAKRVNSVSEALVVCKLSDVLLEYQDFHEFQELGRQLQLMIDEKDGILRTSYRGVVETRPHGGKFLLLTPPFVQIQRSFDQS